ncbi:MAG: DUF4197 domain-containing protein [Gammaproteobacteria bacterium]|nr:DUF4197 domain-containing protein [Gammaproteobacteria bacterium]
MRTSHLLAAVLVAASITLASSPASAGWLEDLFGFGKKKESAPAESAESAPGASLTTSQIAAGLKEALEVGTGRVVTNLGQVDGFNADPLIRIPLPAELDTVRDALGKIGMSGMLDDLETSLNRAAETATPQAKALFVDAIRNLTIDDVMAIYKGPDDAATQYLRGQMSDPLGAAMRPIVSDSLDQVGAAQLYEDSVGRYNALPFVPEVDADLDGYVVDMALDGIFLYLAKEEAAIREDPVARTTDLLKQVFGAAF